MTTRSRILIWPIYSDRLRDRMLSTFALWRIKQYFHTCKILYKHFYRYNVLIHGYLPFGNTKETTMRLALAECTNPKDAKPPNTNMLFFE